MMMMMFMMMMRMMIHSTPPDCCCCSTTKHSVFFLFGAVQELCERASGTRASGAIHKQQINPKPKTLNCGLVRASETSCKVEFAYPQPCSSGDAEPQPPRESSSTRYF